MERVRQGICSARRPFVSQGSVVTNPTMAHPIAASRMVEVDVPSTTHPESVMWPLAQILLTVPAKMCVHFHPTRSATVALEGILGAAGPRRPVSSRGTLPQVSNVSLVCIALFCIVHFLFLRFAVCIISLTHIHLTSSAICLDPPPCDTGLDGAFEDQLAEFDAEFDAVYDEYDEDTEGDMDVDSFEAQGYLRG